jgi:hypothetical protein
LGGFLPQTPGYIPNQMELNLLFIILSAF